MDMSQLDTVTERIKAHVRKPGYIYSFLMTVVKDCFYDANNPEEYENRDKLITEELMTLLGFWLQSPNSKFAYPNSFEELYSMMVDSEALMNNMHFASYELVAAEMRGILENHLELQNKKPAQSLSEEAKAQSIQEAIYYNGDSAYDYEYIHFLPQKYKYDREWLLTNRSFDIEEAGKIVLAIKELLHKKTEILIFTDRSFDFRLMGYEDESEFEMILEFAKYMELIPPLGENALEEEVTESLHQFCDSLLDLFSISADDLKEFNGGKSFLDNFSLELKGKCNIDYKRFGDYNVLQATPILHLENGNYLIPLVYQLFVTTYETPYYWIISDKHYEKTAGSHRGKAGEDMAFELLTPIFGKENILRDIEIKDSKHHTITDIDNLCLLGSKAICIFYIKYRLINVI